MWSQVRILSFRPILKSMKDKPEQILSVYEESVYYIALHNQKHTVTRPWAILEDTKWGPRQFDIYYTKEAAEKAAKLHGLKLKEY